MSHAQPPATQVDAKGARGGASRAALDRPTHVAPAGHLGGGRGRARLGALWALVEQWEGNWEEWKTGAFASLDVPGMEEAQFLELAKKAKESCPVSRALDAIEITLDAKLEA